ncbi:MAG: UpxY family transcription antiterminator [Bacteroidales bacterium]|nr:UpxY family transcription antiterminator [Bacteroidales bacterium]
METSLQNQNIEVFLPKSKSLRVWSDRKKWIEEPMFRPYVFVRISNKEYDAVLKTPSVLFYISFEGQAAPVPDNQIEVLKLIISNNLSYEISRDHLKPGKKAVVSHGPFKGSKVEVIIHKGKSRILVAVDHLQCSLLIEIDADYLLAC